MSYKVVNTFCDPGRDYGEEQLKALGVKFVSGHWTEEDELVGHAGDADGIICVGPAQPWTRRVIRSLSRCRILASLAIGYDRVDVAAASECGIVVTNIPDYCVDEVSNQAIAFLMALNRRLIPLDRAVRKRKGIRFTPSNRKELADHAYPVHRLQDQTLGIIGFGKIGTSVGLKARGLGMRVIAYDPYVFGAVMKSHGVKPVDFDTLIRESDVISIHAYLNNETKDMIGLEEFKKMKPTCYLINTARGGIVNHPALVRALREGLVAGAGLDVTAVEPIPENDPILDIPNVILTGHSAWYSLTADSNSEYWHKAALQVAAALKGEWPIYAVNPEIKQEWLRKWGR